MEKKTSNFSGQLGFVLAAAGSAVGVGNLWRFPYLAAKDGGGLFLIIYHEVRVRVSDGAGFERGAGRLLYVVYHVAGVACGVRPAVYGGDSVHCV